MQRGSLVGIAALLASAGVALAQMPNPAGPEGRTAPTPASTVDNLPALPCLPGAFLSSQDAFVPSCLDAPGFWPGAAASAPRFWVQADYLIGWMKDGSGSPAARSGLAGSDLGTVSGMRVTAGGSLVPNHSFGLQGSGFLMEQRSSSWK